jgi:hypothetical protein
VAGAKYVQALSLTAVSAIERAAGAGIAAGWFKPKRVVEVYVEGSQRAARPSSSIAAATTSAAPTKCHLVPDADDGPAPSRGITLHQKSRLLEIAFADGKTSSCPTNSCA